MQAFDVDDQWAFYALSKKLSLPRLRRLTIGGCIHIEVLENLFDSPEILESVLYFFVQENTVC